MECDQCGARRPRTGPCPECGAPAPGTYSSMRQWRGQSGTGKGPAYGGGGGRGSGADWNDGGSRGGRGSGAGWRAGRPAADAWDDSPDYDDDRPASRSDGRNRYRGSDYEEVDLERALVPTRGGDLLPLDQSAGAVALPGMPATEDEERALGIRRPVYIPAAEGKRKRKLGTWQVVSGVLSVMLVCIASCGVASIVGRNQILIWLGHPVAASTAPATFNSKLVPVTPIATPGPKGTIVKNVVTATGVDANYNAINPTSQFLVNSAVYVVAGVRGIPKGEQHTVSIRWFLQGQDVQLPASSNLSKTIDKESNVYFSLNYPSPGLGMAKVYLDRPATDTGDDPKDPSLAATIYFAVQMPTPVPTKGNTPTPTKKAPTATPAKASTGAAPVAWRGEQYIA